jgi:hypothetical protein
MHPRERGQLEVADVVPGVGIGPVNALGLVEPVDRLRQCIVERLTG